MFEYVLRDVRHAWRTICRAPIVSAVIVLSVALAIGVNTVVFSWIQARFLEPVPGVSGGARLQLIEPRSEAGLYAGTSWPEYQDLRGGLRSFPDLFASRMVPLYVGGAGQVDRVFGLLVSDNYFSALGLEPQIGRFLAPEEGARPGADPVAVISYGLWQTRFASAPDALGRTVRVNGLDLTVIGVTPRNFQGTVLGLNFDLWLPATLAPLLANGSRELEDRDIRGYALMGRLAPLTTRAQAQGELTAFMRRLGEMYPETNARMTAEVLPFYQSPRGPQRMLNTALLVLQGIMLLLLVAVCGNVATLMLARASARHKEMGARFALGAGRPHVVRLVLTENVLLALAGTALGAALAVWGTRALMVLPLTGLPIRFETSVDGMGLAFALGLGIFSGLAFGLIPATQLASVSPSVALRASANAPSASRLRKIVMGFQVGLALIVLIVAAMFFRSFMETRTTDPGFERERVLLAAYDLAGRNAGPSFSRELATRTIDRLSTVPGVERVAIASSVPLDIHGLPSRVFTVEGHVRLDDGFDEALTNVVTPGYFDVMGIPITAGRDFADLNDTDTAPQAIVNEEFVRRFVRSGVPIGRRMEARGRQIIIAGVVRNSLYNAFGEPPAPAIYFSYRDMPQSRGEIHLRTRGSAATSLAPEVRRVMRDVDGELPVFNVRSMADHVETNLIFRRIPARMFAVLGPMLLVLAAIGIYAVVAYAVAVRTIEIDIRVALGATPARVVRQFVSEYLPAIGIGSLLGWLVALIASSQVPGGRAADVAVFAGVPAILMGVALIACSLPAWRAAKSAHTGARLPTFLV